MNLKMSPMDTSREICQEHRTPGFKSGNLLLAQNPGIQAPKIQLIKTARSGSVLPANGPDQTTA